MLANAAPAKIFRCPDRDDDQGSGIFGIAEGFKNGVIIGISVTLVGGHTAS